MILLTHELGLGGDLEQEIAVGGSDIFLAAIRPHILRHGFPTGGVKMEVRNASKTLLRASEEISIASMDLDVDPAGADFFHGEIRFLINLPLKKNTNFFIRMVGASGYTFSEPTYIGWVNDFDLKKVDRDYNPNLDEEGALLMEIWERERVLRATA